jgi:hypothetical protein
LVIFLLNKYVPKISKAVAIMDIIDIKIDGLKIIK